MRRDAFPTAALVGTLCLLWALTFIVQRSALASAIEPLWLAAGRSLVAAVLLAPLLWRPPRLTARGWRIAVLLGLTNIVGFTGGQMIGLADVARARPRRSSTCSPCSSRSARGRSSASR